MSFYLTEPVDFTAHNAEVERVWSAYRAGRPYRVPIMIHASNSNFLCNPEINTTGHTFEDYFNDPQVQIDVQLAYSHWQRHHWLFDQPMGPPNDGWVVARVDFQNSREASWFGAPLKFDGNAIPDTIEIFAEDKNRLYETAPPDPLKSGLMGRTVEFYEYMLQKCPTMEFHGRPVLPPPQLPTGYGTDGPFTIACKLRGMTNFCMDLYDDEKYFHDLMAFVTENTIRRMRAVREWNWVHGFDLENKDVYQKEGFDFADDAVAMLSVEQYEEFVLPYHRRLTQKFSPADAPIAIHLCGNATHLFPFLRDNLNVRSFDTGFPVDFTKLREQLGPDVEVRGGPTIMLLKDGTLSAIRDEVRRICKSGIMDGGRFILRDANNLAPQTPVESIAAMYEAGKEFGKYV